MKSEMLKLAGLLFVLYTVAFSIAYGQPTNQTKVPQVIPPSPDVAALGKYGSIPVGLSTGIPDISIPIFTVKQGSLQLPISLSYHASGIKVSEVASWVGLGWVLNAGGNVSRSVVGKADNVSGFWVNTVKSHDQINWTNDYLYLRGVADNTFDAESDFYFYNFNGHSGKFVYKQNQGNASPQLIPEAPIKIVYTSPGFQITDESGTVYKFGAIENMTVDGTVIESSCHLSEIVSADGIDHIYFTYVADNSYSEFNPTFTETVGQQCAQNMVGPPSHGYYNSTGMVGSGRDITSLRLTEINYGNGKIEFLPGARSDLPPWRLSEIKISSKNSNGTFTLLKSLVLGAGYFFSPTGVGKDQYRLKLSGVTEKDASGAAVNGHSFKYQEDIVLPHRQSLAQDWWGYYNGKTGNTSLIASENVNFLGQGYVVGGADRNPNAATMQAGMLKSIIYPTGGYTEFDYEPHYYAGGTTTTQQSISASSGAAGNTTTLLQQTVPFTPSTSGWVRVVTFCSNVTDAVPFFSTVIVKKQGDTQKLLDHKYDPAVYSPYNPELSKEFLVYVIGGNTYELTVMSKGTSTSTLMSGAAFSQAQLYWYQTTSGTSTIAGGLRVKEVRDYSNPGESPIVKMYRYGVGESGNGTLLIPFDGIGSAKQEVKFIYSYVYTPGGMFGTGCYEACNGLRLVISSRAPLDLTTLGGSPVAYEEVTVYQGATSAPLGKQKSKFDVLVDQMMATDKAYNNGRYQINDSWKGGDEILTTLYKGASTKAKENANVNSVYKSSTTIGTKVGWRVNHEGCGEPHPIGFDTCCNTDLFYAFDYPMYSGVKKITSSKETLYSMSTPSKYTIVQTDFEYDNLNSNHQQLSRKIVLDSDGSKYENHYWYPADYLNIGEIIPLMTKNIINTPIKEEVHRNDQIISGKVIRLNSDGKPIEVHQYESLTPQTPPVHNGGTIVPAGYVKKLDISYHATVKQIIQTQPVNNHATAYIWGYNGAYPTAMIVNATSTSVAATSFESNDKGNWSYTGATLASATSKTGSYHWRLGSGKNVTKSLAAGTYKLEYWGKGTVNLLGGTITAIRTSAADANGWILYEKQVTMAATTTLSLSGGTSAYLDEVRVYPITAQMTTYTYNVERGITSVTDPNNVITYYEYDAAGRLKLIKDNNRHVVKAYDYHFKGY